MRTRSAFLSLALAALAVVALPRPAEAQPCDFCVDREYGTAGWEHSFFTPSGAVFDCQSGAGCHFDYYLGLCANNHDADNCGDAWLGNAQRLLVALSEADVEGVKQAIAAANTVRSVSTHLVVAFSDCQGVDREEILIPSHMVVRATGT